MKLLSDRFSSLKKGELILLYGRRRVGKTELVQEFLKQVPRGQGAYLYIDEASPEDNLRIVCSDLSRIFKETVVLANWSELWEFISAKAERGKLFVAVDEFQRLHGAPGAITRLQKEWDLNLKEKQVMLVLLGSAYGTIHKLAVAGRAPLFGRLTGKVKLEPLRYSSFRSALSGISEAEKIRLYSIFGGMPHYLQFAQEYGKPEELQKGNTHDKKLTSLLDSTMLFGASPLRDEPTSLLNSELRDPSRYNSVISAVASGKQTLKEITDRVGFNSQFYLDVLVEPMGLLKAEEPVCGKKKSARYRIRDGFCRFWYKFVFSNKSSLEMGNLASVKRQVMEQIGSLEGTVFEEIVLDVLKSCNNDGLEGLAGGFTNIGRWWNRSGEELDICCIGEKSLLLGEVKYSNEPVGVEVVQGLLRKRTLVECTPAQASNTRLLIVSKNGFTQNATQMMEERGIIGWDMDKLISLLKGISE